MSELEQLRKEVNELREHVCNERDTYQREADKLAAENKVLRDALGNHVYTFRRRGQDNFCTCDKARYLELKDKPSLFEVAILYTRSKS